MRQEAGDIFVEGKQNLYVKVFVFVLLFSVLSFALLRFVFSLNKIY